jgi:hypothetical protein
MRPRTAVLALTALVGAMLAAAPTATAATVCVGSQPGCFATIQAAVDVAADGDSIVIAPGTYAGGVTIDTSIALAGAGANRTVIRGGGPVLTIGDFGAAHEPTVSIDRVTITGGVTRSSPQSVPFTGQEGVFAVGGGIEIPPNADFSGGATVTISNSVIAGNKVAPADTVPAGPPCPHGPCPFAFAAGGGIDSWGTLTLVHTAVTRNRIGSASGLSSLASDVNGGAIASWLGPLTISESAIYGNRARATGPNGRFAEGGAVLADGGPVAITGTSVTDNHAALDASLPSSVEQLAVGGGVKINGGVSTARIRDTALSGNSISMTNTRGAAVAFSGGLHVDLGVDFRMGDAVIADNSVSSATLAGSRADAEGDTGGAALLGSVTNTRLTGNSVEVSSAAGDATAAAGASFFVGSLTNSQASGNSVRASSPRGTAYVAGGGLVIDEGGATLRSTTISGNTAHAGGREGAAQGGGIFDGSLFSNGGPLSLVNSRVTGNALTGAPGIVLQGGGLYIGDQQVTVANSVIAQNTPDDCFGCESSIAPQAGLVAKPRWRRLHNSRSRGPVMPSQPRAPSR